MRFGVYFAHQCDHISEVADARFGQVALLGAFVCPGRHLIEFCLQPVEIGQASPAQGPAQTNEIRE